MKYTREVVIHLLRERVVSLFDDPANLVKWQPGLVGFEPLEGAADQPGAAGSKTRGHVAQAMSPGRARAGRQTE